MTTLLDDDVNRQPPGQAEALVSAIPALESLADAMRPSDVVRAGAAR